MKTKTIFLFLVAMFLFVGCAANSPEVSSSSASSPSTISVTGYGEASASPDIVNIQFGVEAVSPDPAVAVNENTTQMNAVMEILQGLKIEDKDIQTVNYSMWVEMIYDNNGQPTGEQRYHISNQVIVRLHDLTLIGALLEKVIDAGVNNISGINFAVEDTTALAQTAMDNALANAQQKAGRMAEDLNIVLGKVINVYESGAYTPPVPYYGEKMAVGMGGGGDVPISAGQYSMSVQVQVIFEISE